MAENATPPGLGWPSKGETYLRLFTSQEAEAEGLGASEGGGWAFTQGPAATFTHRSFWSASAGGHQVVPWWGGGMYLRAQLRDRAYAAAVQRWAANVQEPRLWAQVGDHAEVIEQ